MVWDPEQYGRFEAQRARPFWDLAGMVQPEPDMTLVDLGCGTGKLTLQLHRKLAAQHTIGIDQSGQMLSRSNEFVTPDVSFEQADLGQIQIRPPRDLVFSNAALHWLPDHEPLLAHIADNLAPGGQLAVQVPANHDQWSHLTADAVAREAHYAGALQGWKRPVHVLTPIEYDRILRDLGFDQRRVEMRIYGHELASLDDVVEWVRGSLLTAYARRLDAPLFARFVQDYRRRLHQEIGDRRPFYFQYKRILMWGRRTVA
ncbi:MAG: trans-aconitate 2-methyltransferase [Myxococcota bacterium]|jgi:trans-aconitate 2-methyltransferase